ncbi:MAG: BamA/TamA family outer membrane protein [candidate division Zixibacteria bacterium]|nr:BamA/TamA family outer membrane protein [candidate division Zixibacteria bacterium]MBU1471422.1 BamA/TamA family outer membrane protein [candidate division Zixibacteria bacterium]MBU2625326.1 BamA/TamA family outer membrane protein [candidate division Zixibacteria bacterium]
MIRRSCLTCIFLFLLISGVSSVCAERDPQLKWLGKKPLISKVEVNGNEYFSDGKVKSLMRSQENGFWQSLRLSERHRLRKDSKRYDMAALQYLYLTNGFVDSKIEEEFVVAEDSSAIVKITVVEGKRYLIRSSTTYSDLGSFGEAVAHQLRQLRQGDPLNPRRIEQVAFDIKTVYANSGYPYADVRDSVSVDSEVDSADVTFFIERGPLTVFGDVHVDSLEFTKPSTFTRELVFKPGDVYSRQMIIDSRQRVYSTGLASYVDLTVKNAPSSDTSSIHDVRPDFLLKVRERKPRYAKIKTGAGEDDEQDLVWDLGLEFGNRNISGRGRQVRFGLVSSFLVFAGDWRILKERFEFEYSEPWLLKIRMPLHLTFGVEPGVRSETQRYRISRIDLGLTTARELSRSTVVSGGIEYEQVKITGIPADELDDLKKEEGISVQRKVLFLLERDTRNNLLLPIRGSYARLDAEYVGGFLGGDNSFVKLQGNVSRYQNFYGSNIYAWQYRIGWVLGTASDPYVPTTDRFYFGGGKSLRGYVSSSVGPATAEGEPAGGRVLIQTNQEVRRPLFWNFWGSTFIDAGNNYEDFKYFKLDNLLVSGGVGLQYISPVGPIRLDYGHRLIHGGYPPGGRFHFSILYAF